MRPTFRSFFTLLFLASAFAVVASADVVGLGKKVLMTATADGTAPFNFAWSKNGQPIPGQTTDTLVIPSFTATDAATYSVSISNAAGSISTSVVLTQQVVGPSNPKITVIQQIIAWLKKIFKSWV